MQPLPEPEVNVDALMARVRAEVARRHAGSAPRAADPVMLIPDGRDVQRLLDAAPGPANIGTTVPPFGTFGPLRRPLARFVTRILYYFLQVITVEQRHFNNLVLDGLRLITRGLQHGEAALRAHLARLEQTLARQGSEITLQERHIGALVDQVRRHSFEYGRRGEQTDLRTAGERRALDAFYAQFEDQFRGHRDDIKNRLRVYLPIIRDAEVGTEDKPVADLGCGRGEWLELLRDAGRCAYGVELNPLFVDQCRGLGLDVKTADVTDHLRSLPPSSLGAVTAFHLVEHLPFPLVLQLLDEAKRVLQPGGVLILETPNPENVIVGSCHFYADPTHDRPLFPPTLQFLMAHRGFHDLQLSYLNRPPGPEPPPFLSAEDPLAPSVNPLIDFVRRHVFAPPCFAIVGWKLP
jgi:SAM-dependent methyltransferase